MNERHRWGLRGPVRSCRLRRTWYPQRCGGDACETGERGDTTLVEFRSDGSLARRWHQNPDGSEWTSTYEYDDASRLVTVRTGSAARQLDVQRFEYDSVGRLMRIVVPIPDGNDRVAETFEYDATGRKTQTRQVDSNTMYAVEGTDAFYSAPGAATLTTLHNTRGQPTELLFNDKDGRTLSRVELVYDEMGNLVEEVQIMGVETLPAEAVGALSAAERERVRALFAAGARRVHRYDARGHRIETHTSILGSLGRDLKTYNDRGDPAEQISEYEQRECHDGGKLSVSAGSERVSRSEVRFHYDYDARGNWTRKVVEARGGAGQNFSVSSVEERTLAYDD